MGGGAWPFLVGGAICLVNSVNERDLSLLTSHGNPTIKGRAARLVGRAFRCPDGGSRCPSLVGFARYFLEGLFDTCKWKFEAITGL